VEFFLNPRRRREVCKKSFISILTNAPSLARLLLFDSSLSYAVRQIPVIRRCSSYVHRHFGKVLLLRKLYVYIATIILPSDSDEVRSDKVRTDKVYSDKVHSDKRRRLPFYIGGKKVDFAAKELLQSAPFKG
jgi:hypothetical protein